MGNVCASADARAAPVGSRRHSAGEARQPPASTGRRSSAPPPLGTRNLIPAVQRTSLQSLASGPGHTRNEAAQVVEGVKYKVGALEVYGGVLTKPDFDFWFKGRHLFLKAGTLDASSGLVTDSWGDIHKDFLAQADSFSGVLQKIEAVDPSPVLAKIISAVPTINAAVMSLFKADISMSTTAIGIVHLFIGKLVRPETCFGWSDTDSYKMHDLEDNLFSTDGFVVKAGIHSTGKSLRVMLYHSNVAVDTVVRLAAPVSEDVMVAYGPEQDATGDLPPSTANAEKAGEPESNEDDKPDDIRDGKEEAAEITNDVQADVEADVKEETAGATPGAQEAVDAQDAKEETAGVTPGSQDVLDAQDAKEWTAVDVVEGEAEHVVETKTVEADDCDEAPVVGRLTLVVPQLSEEAPSDSGTEDDDPVGKAQSEIPAVVPSPSRRHTLVSVSRIRSEGDVATAPRLNVVTLPAGTA